MEKQLYILNKKVVMFYGFMDTGYFGERSKIKFDKASDEETITIKRVEDKEYISFYYSIILISDENYAILVVHHRSNLDMKEMFALHINSMLNEKYKLNVNDKHFDIKFKLNKLMPDALYDKFLKSKVNKIIFTKKGIPLDEAQKLIEYNQKNDKKNDNDTFKNITKQVTYRVKNENENFLEYFIKKFPRKDKKYNYIEILNFEPDDIKVEIDLENNKTKVLKLSEIDNSARYCLDISDEECIEYNANGELNLEKINEWIIEYLELFV